MLEGVGVEDSALDVPLAGDDPEAVPVLDAAETEGDSVSEDGVELRPMLLVGDCGLDPEVVSVGVAELDGVAALLDGVSLPTERVDEQP
jgi:hypothetical protein